MPRKREGQRQTGGPPSPSTFAVYTVPTINKTLWAELDAPPGEFTVAATLQTQVAHVIHPSSETGPEPVLIPVTGHRIVLDLICIGTAPATDLRIEAEVMGAASFTSDGLPVTVPGGNPSLILAKDLEASYKAAADGYFMLEPPDLVIILDFAPPAMLESAPEEGMVGAGSAIPSQVRPGEPVRLVLSPVTHYLGRIDWRLTVTWIGPDAAERSSSWNLSVTGHTGTMIFRPHQDPIPAPVGEVAADHVDVTWEQPPTSPEQ